jgi:transcriptional regulator with XRE-family HTH domain
MSAAGHVDDQRLQMAQRLREARDYVGLSQDEVATALQLSRPAITLIESGGRKVEAIELDKLARLYGRAVQFFITGEESGSSPEGRIGFLARSLNGLTDKDIQEVARFAEFLKRSPKIGPKGK